MLHGEGLYLEYIQTDGSYFMTRDLQVGAGRDPGENPHRFFEDL